MIEANNTRAGFFSSIFQVLNYCHRAEILNDDIKINKFSLCYLDRNMGYDTSFHQYFEDTKNINKNLKYPIKFN